MATAAFRSTSRRGAAAESKDPSTAAASRWRSHSVSAVYRKTPVPFDDNHTLISTDFSNSRDNPLFWATSSSPTEKEESGKISRVASGNQKQSTRNTRNGNDSSGNSVSELRGRSVTRNLGDKNGIGRSLSRARGRSVSRAPCNGAYEGEKEHDFVTSTIAQSRYEMKKVGNVMNSSVRNRSDKRGHANTGVMPIRDQATEWSEDDSACSFQISNLEDGISLCSLSEAEDRTTKAACEESNTSNERKRMSKCLTEEALAYFDECASLSTFVSSDFSASEDPTTYSSVGATGASSPVKGGTSNFCYDQGSGPHHKQLHSCEDSGLTANSSSSDPAGITQHYQFSFADRKSRSAKPQEDIVRSYIKNFERDTNKDIDLDLESTRSYYDAGEYAVQGHIESVLIDRVLYSSRIGSGGLLLCGGATSSPPFASVV